MEKQLILVDKDNNVIGYSSKNEVHKKGLLHRAFSVFIYDWTNEKMLLQRRAVNKYHSGGLWSNACCSHPYKDEIWSEAIQRCMKDELGIVTSVGNDIFRNNTCRKENSIQFLKSFHYNTKIMNMIENEIDYVFLYSSDKNISQKIHINKNEVEEVKWVSINELNSLVVETPELFSTWFSKAYEIVKKVIQND